MSASAYVHGVLSVKDQFSQIDAYSEDDVCANCLIWFIHVNNLALYWWKKNSFFTIFRVHVGTNLNNSQYFYWSICISGAVVLKACLLVQNVHPGIFLTASLDRLCDEQEKKKSNVIEYQCSFFCTVLLHHGHQLSCGQKPDAAGQICQNILGLYCSGPKQRSKVIAVECTI